MPVKQVIETKIGPLYTEFQAGEKIIIFLNGRGLFSARDNFSLVIEQLPADVGFLAVDFPNSGQSPMTSQQGISLSDYAEALEQLCANYQLTEFYLCLHSLSGLVSLAFLHQTSRTCLGLLAVEPTTVEVLFGELAKSPYPQVLELRERLKAQNLTLEDYLRQMASNFFNQAQERALWQHFEACQKARQESQKDPDFVLEPELRAEDFAARISDTIPVIIFVQDFRAEELRRSTYYNQHAQTRLVIGGDSHYVHWERSDQILAALTELVSSKK